jgi:hypothetical protein
MEKKMEKNPVKVGKFDSSGFTLAELGGPRGRGVVT